MSDSNGRAHSDVTKNARAKHTTGSMDVVALIETVKESFEVSYPDKDPLGPVSGKPLPFPKATPELIRWTNTFVEQVSYRYSKEVKEVKEENIRLHHELEEVRLRLEITLSENDKLKKENHSLHKENEGLRCHVDELQDEIGQLHLDISSLKVTIESLRKEHLSLIKKIEILEQQVIVHQKEIAILVSQLEVYQGNLAESQHMWFLAVKSQHELELTIRKKSEQLTRVELEKDGLDAKIKLLEKQIGLSSQRASFCREEIVEWEKRFTDKTIEIMKLLEISTSMDKVCKVSAHGKEHQGFPKGVPGYVPDKDLEPPKKPKNGSDPPPKSGGGPPVTPVLGDKKPAAAPKVEEGKKDARR